MTRSSTDTPTETRGPSGPLVLIHHLILDNNNYCIINHIHNYPTYNRTSLHYDLEALNLTINPVTANQIIKEARAHNQCPICHPLHSLAQLLTCTLEHK